MPKREIDTDADISERKRRTHTPKQINDAIKERWAAAVNYAEWTAYQKLEWRCTLAAELNILSQKLGYQPTWTNHNVQRKLTKLRHAISTAFTPPRDDEEDAEDNTATTSTDCEITLTPQPTKLNIYFRRMSFTLKQHTQLSKGFANMGLRGNAFEDVMIAWMRLQFASNVFSVGCGEVLNSASQQRQLDCVLYDTRQPSFVTSLIDTEAPRLFTPESVVCAIEMKTTLTGLGIALTMCRSLGNVPYIIIALNSQMTMTCLKTRLTQEQCSNCRAVFVFEQGLCMRQENGEYEMIRDGEPNCVLAELWALLFSYTQQRAAEHAVCVPRDVLSK